MAPHDDEDEASAPLIAASSSHTSLPDEQERAGCGSADGAQGSAKRYSRFREEMGESEEDLGVEVDGEEDTEGEVDMEGEGGEVDESKMLRPGVFVWCLTLCAGVSGLLFGYEYVYSLIFLECTSWAKNSRCSTTWYDLTMRSTS